jgi:hypothetical protein|tara:strand:+ start:201 stop:416 length:216 start_codon:yes stop_codon:yes gene_type:complete
MSFIKEYSFTRQQAIEICEQLVPSENEEEIAAWQYLIDTGLAWKLQGWFGRTAKRLIDEGYCTYTDRADVR